MVTRNTAAAVEANNASPSAKGKGKAVNHTAEEEEEEEEEDEEMGSDEEEEDVSDASCFLQPLADASFVTRRVDMHEATSSRLQYLIHLVFRTTKKKKDWKRSIQLRSLVVVALVASRLTTPRKRPSRKPDCKEMRMMRTAMKMSR